MSVYSAHMMHISHADVCCINWKLEGSRAEFFPSNNDSGNAPDNKSVVHNRKHELHPL